MTGLIVVLVIVIIAASAGFLLMGGEEDGNGGGVQENVVEMYHWWTAGGEKNAIDKAITMFQDQTKYQVIQNTVAGGGGGPLLSTVKQKFAAGNPPDTFQALYGRGTVYSWRDRLTTINEAWTDDYKEVVPEAIQELGMYDGDHYLMPLNIHTYNDLWYNKEIVEEAGIDMPLNSFDEFLNALEKVKTNTDYVPLAFGVGWKGWYTQLFSSILSRESESWQRRFLLEGDINPEESDVIREAMEDYATIFKEGYVNQNYTSITWDEAGDMIANDEAAFNTMGDWQNGHLMAVGATPGEDYGQQWFPGATMIQVHGDSFGVAEGAPHPEATMAWINAMKDKDIQVEFCIRKGATPPRTDTEVEPFGAIQTQIIQDVRGEQMPIISDPAGGPEGMRANLANALSFLAANPDSIDEALTKFDQEYEALTFP